MMKLHPQIDWKLEADHINNTKSTQYALSGSYVHVLIIIL